jgi:hypothetical protein
VDQLTKATDRMAREFIREATSTRRKPMAFKNDEARQRAVVLINEGKATNEIVTELAGAGEYNDVYSLRHTLKKDKGIVRATKPRKEKHSKPGTTGGGLEAVLKAEEQHLRNRLALLSDFKDVYKDARGSKIFAAVEEEENRVCARMDAVGDLVANFAKEP